MAIQVQVVVDCADPTRLVAFWAKALGYQPDGATAAVDPAGAGPRFLFERVPEPKQVKNRMHVDLKVAVDPAREPRTQLQAEVERLTALGASLVEPVDEAGEYWIVMRDPEGNEFCIH